MYCTIPWTILWTIIHYTVQFCGQLRRQFRGQLDKSNTNWMLSFHSLSTRCSGVCHLAADNENQNARHCTITWTIIQYTVQFRQQFHGQLYNILYNIVYNSRDNSVDNYEYKTNTNWKPGPCQYNFAQCEELLLHSSEKIQTKWSQCILSMFSVFNVAS